MVAVVEDSRTEAAAVESLLQAMVTRAVVTLVDDTKNGQELQLVGIDEDVEDEVEHVQPYGFSAHPPTDASALKLHVGADASYPVAIGVYSREHRPTGLEEGEVALHALHGEVRLLVGSDGNLYLNAAGATFRVARADRVEAELQAIQVALAAAQAPPGGGALTYTPPSAAYETVGSVGSDSVFVRD